MFSNPLENRHDVVAESDAEVRIRTQSTWHGAIQAAVCRCERGPWRSLKRGWREVV